MFVIKRDGTRAVFDPNKIINASEDGKLKVEVKDQDIVRYSYINWHKS